MVNDGRERIAGDNMAGSDLERVLDKLDSIGSQISDLAVRIARIEPLADQHKDLSAKVAILDTKLAELANRVTILETKLMVAATLAASAGGAIGLGLSKVFGAG